MEDANTHMDFKQLLSKAAIEKAPKGFTQKVMQHIVPDYEEAKSPFFFKPKFWMILGGSIAVIYLLISQLKITWTAVSNHFFFFVEDVQQFIQSIEFSTLLKETLEFTSYYFSQFLGNIHSYFISQESPQQFMIFVIPILILILAQRVYDYFALVRKTA